MSLLRPNIKPSGSCSRPSIYDLATFLLSPRTYYTSCPRLTPIARRFSTRTSLLSAGPHSSNLKTPLTKLHDRGPSSTEETQTDFGSLNILGNTPAPSTSIDACLWDGFHLNNGVKIVGGSGVLLVAGEAFGWKPWEATVDKDGGIGGGRWLVNKKGQWEVGDEAWGLLGLVWPKPDLLILGLGKEMRPLSPKTRQYVNSLGIRIDIQDTRNAAAQFNLLATERGVGSVAAALIPLGWREGLGVKQSG